MNISGATARWMLQQLSDGGEGTSWDRGLQGSCYECPFASPPLERDGRPAAWEDVSNDPSEAWFRCSLPGRDNEAVAWGEYSPCTAEEWVSVLLQRGVPANPLVVKSPGLKS